MSGAEPFDTPTANYRCYCRSNEIAKLTTDSIIFLLLLFIIAMLYSSVGHGGASGYLALMGLFHFAPEVMRPTALVLNLFVSFIAWMQYSRSVVLEKKLFLWLVAGSIPAAFAGALITIDATLYKQILGGLLILPALRMFGFFSGPSKQSKPPSILPAVFIGIVIGFISGIIGIGGGIILSPLLLLLGWTDIRQTALISALFIFVNSLSGMTGLIVQGVEISAETYSWIAVAVVGGAFGSWAGSTKFSSVTLKHILGVVLVIAGVKLMIF